MADAPSSETSFFCPYSGHHVPISRRSNEHVLTEALASGGGIQIDVARELNNRLGDEVDAPFVREPALEFLASTRFVKGKTGRITRYEHRVRVPFEGHELELKVNKRGRDIGLVDYDRKFTEPDGASFYAIVRENETAAARAMAELESKLARKGIVPAGELVRGARTHALGNRFSFKANGIAAGRFFAKVALGATFFMLEEGGWGGETWARSSLHAGALRRVLFAGHDPRGPIFDMGFTQKDWTSLARPEERLSFGAYDGRPHEHEVAIAPEPTGTYLYVNLFGVIGARLRVATVPYGPIAYAVAYRTGELRRLQPRAA